MTFYQYDAIDGLSRLCSDPLTEQREHQSWEDYLRANGYACHIDTLGDDSIGWSLAIRYTDDKVAVKPEYPYLVELSSSCQGEMIFCRDFTSAAECVRSYAPLVLAEIVFGAAESLKSRLDEEWNRTERIRERERQLAKQRTG